MGDEARQHLSLARAGQITLTPEQDYAANLVAQQGKGNLERVWDKIKGGYQGLASAYNYSSKEPTILQSVGSAISDEYNKEKAMSPMERIGYGLKTPFNMSTAGAAATAKAIPAMAETAYDAYRLSPLNPIGQIESILEATSPQSAQKLEAGENAATDLMTHYTNTGVDAAVKASGADTENLPSKIAEQVTPLVAMGAIPMGEAGSLEEGIANAATGLNRGLQKSTAYVDRAAAQARIPTINS